MSSAAIVKHRGRPLLIFAVLLLGLLITFQSLAPQRAEAAPLFPGAEQVSISTQCLSDGTVRVTASWVTFNQGPQWVDLSLFNNGWIFGTFLGAGPLPSTQSSLTWDGLLPGVRHFLRVNTLTFFGWFPSPTVSFITPICGGCPVIQIFPPIIAPCPPPPPPPPPPPAQCGAGPLAQPAIVIGNVTGCVTTTQAVYAIGQTVTFCYSVSQPLFVRIEVRRPNGTNFSAVNGFDDGTGGCVASGAAGFPLGVRTVSMFGGLQSANQLLDQAQYSVQ